MKEARAPRLAALAAAFGLFLGVGWLAPTPAAAQPPMPDAPAGFRRDVGAAATDGGAPSPPVALANHPEPNSPPTEDEDAWGLGGYPIVGYAPESSLVLGAGLVIYSSSRPGSPEQRPDEYALNVSYSLKSQGSVSIDAIKYLRGNDLFFNGSIEVMNTPNSFYGIGPSAPDSAQEEYTQAGVAFSLAPQAMVLPGLYLGPEYDLIYSRITDVEPGSMLAGGMIAGSGTAIESGIGVLVTHDTTNRHLYKRAGARLELRARLYHAALGSSHGFGTSSLDARRFISLTNRLVLALHAAVASAYGDVPFFSLPSLGGNRLLRGYSAVRHLAHHFVGAQAELRHPLVWRLGGVAFLGVAEVQERIADFGTVVRAAGGLGLRLALNQRQSINIRFDLTYNSEGEVEKYLKLREAF